MLTHFQLDHAMSAYRSTYHQVIKAEGRSGTVPAPRSGQDGGRRVAKPGLLPLAANMITGLRSGR